MIQLLAGEFAKELSTRLGWLLTLCGLILPAMQLYDHLTCAPTMATVTAIEQICEVKSCRMGSCDWRRLSCSKADAAIQSGREVRRIPHAKLRFTTEHGAELTARPRLSKLELTHVDVGAVLPILYRRTHPGYVTTRTTHWLSLIGFAVSAVGVALLWFGRVAAGRKEPPVQATSPRGGAGSKQAAAVWATRARSQDTRPHAQPGARTAVRHAPAVRQGPVQRNTGWFS